MGGACSRTFCGPDLRPKMKIKLIAAKNVAATDDDTEADAFVVFSYGDISKNRYEIRRSKIVETKDNTCTWNEEYTFIIGSLHSTQSLMIELRDQDAFDDHLLGKSTIYYGSHPLNTNISSPRRRSNSVDVQVSKIKNKEDYKHFLPMEWNTTVQYRLTMTKNDGESGRLYLEITMENNNLKTDNITSTQTNNSDTN